MLKQLVSKKASADFKPTSKQRLHYGLVGGCVGIFINAVVFLIEVFVGLITNSIAITADAFHNLADVFSSVITIFSFNFASKPADKEHPFGHGRIEYISSLIVAFIVLMIGATFLKNSFIKIFHPTDVKFDMLSLVLILCTIPFKLLLSLFNRRMGALIDSSVLKASSVDALSDVGILSVAMVSLIAAAFTKFHVDGFLGILVAFVILHSGYTIAKDSLNPLLGEPVDCKIADEIIEKILTYKYITGVHDLVVHNYGPNRFMATIHAEVPSNIPVSDLHDSIDEAEKDIYEEYDIFTVIHLDPLNNNDIEVKEAKATIMDVIEPLDEIISIHDFRVIGKGIKKNLIFDAVVTDKIKTNADKDNLRAAVNKLLHKEHQQYNAVISFDRSYTK